MIFRKYSVKITGLVVSLLIATSLVGCRSDKQAASGVATEFLEDMKAGNKDAAKLLLTRDAQSKWNKEVSDASASQSGGESYTVGDTTVTDQTASVPVTIKEEKGDTVALAVKLRKEDSQWRVYAMSIPNDNFTLTIDFEHPEAIAADLMRAAGQQIGEGMKSFGKGLQAFGEGVQSGLKSNNSPSSSSNK